MCKNFLYMKILELVGDWKNIELTLWALMIYDIVVIIGWGIVVFPDGTKPLPEPVLISAEWCGTHLTNLTDTQDIINWLDKPHKCGCS